MSDHTIVIVNGARTAMAEYIGTPGYGKLAHLNAMDLGGIAGKAAMERGGVSPESIDHVVFGNALQTTNDAIYTFTPSVDGKGSFRSITP